MLPRSGVHFNIRTHLQVEEVGIDNEPLTPTRTSIKVPVSTSELGHPVAVSRDTLHRVRTLAMRQFDRSTVRTGWKV